MGEPLSNMTFAPLLPIGVVAPVVVLMLATAGMAMCSIGRRRRGTGRLGRALQIVGLLLMSLLLLRPGVTDAPAEPAPDPAAPAARSNDRTQHEELRASRAPSLAILVDDSPSMATRDVRRLPADAIAAHEPPNLISRAEAVNRLWRPPGRAAWDIIASEHQRTPSATTHANGTPVVREVHLSDLIARNAIADHRFPEGAASVGVTREGGSPLIAALTHLASSELPAGSAILLLSDGRDTTAQSWRDAAHDIEAAGYPVFPVIFGSGDTRANRRVQISTDRRVVQEGEIVTLRAQVLEDVGTGNHGWADTSDRLRVRLDGVVVGEATLHEAIKPNGVIFRLRPVRPTPANGADQDAIDRALVACTVEVDAAPGETMLDDNAAHVILAVERRHLQVVLFEGEPYWDSRYLIDTLRHDPAIDLTTVIALGDAVRTTQFASPRHTQRASKARPDSESEDGTIDPPLTPVALRDFDIIIFGRHVDRWFTGEAVRALEHHLTRAGGHLVLARGTPWRDPDSGLRDLLQRISPIAFGEVSLQAVRLGVPASSPLPLAFSDAAPAAGPWRLEELIPAAETTTVWLTAEHDRAGRGTSPAVASGPINADGEITSTENGEASSRSGRLLVIAVSDFWRLARPAAPRVRSDGTSIEDARFGRVDGEGAVSLSTFARFWRFALRHLAGRVVDDVGAGAVPSDAARLSGIVLDRTSFNLGETVALQMRLPDLSSRGQVLVREPDGNVIVVDPPQDQEQRATNDQPAPVGHSHFRPDQTGIYRAWLATGDPPADARAEAAAAPFIVHARDPEVQNIAADFAAMSMLARMTGGEVLPADDPEEAMMRVRAWFTSHEAMSSQAPRLPHAAEHEPQQKQERAQPEFRPLLPLSIRMFVIVLGLVLAGWVLEAARSTHDDPRPPQR